jgi:hypothetical protein
LERLKTRAERREVVAGDNEEEIIGNVARKGGNGNGGAVRSSFFERLYKEEEEEEEEEEVVVVVVVVERNHKVSMILSRPCRQRGTRSRVRSTNKSDVLIVSFSGMSSSDMSGDDRDEEADVVFSIKVRSSWPISSEVGPRA